MDPHYYSPFKVSYRFHGLLAFAANRARDEYFLERQIAGLLPPHSTTTGFVYGFLDSGVKYAHVVIAGKNRYEAFDFALPIPGPRFVGTNINVNTIYPGKISKISNLIPCEHCLPSSLVAQQTLTALAMVIHSTWLS